MKIDWRGKQYNFTPRILEAGRDKEGAGAKVTIDKNIYAFDTESVALPDRYEPICFQVSAPNGNGEDLIYLPERAKSLEIFLDYFIRRFSWIELETHYAFMYAHNLVYDWLQLVKLYPDLLSIARTGIGFKEDYEIYRTNDYKVTLRKGGLFTGTAPHFTIQVYLSKREWFDLMFRDTFSFFPSSLSKLSKALGLEAEKLERQDSLGRIDWRKEPDSEEKRYFEKYSKVDSLATRLTGEKIRELHESAGMKRIRVSSPGYAINKLYHSIPEGTKILSGTNDSDIMQLILDSYAGGRTGGIYHGRAENISVLDFHSSYPASMLSLPSFAPTMEYVDYPEPENITEEELLGIIDEAHCFMSIDGEETDEKYPALIKSVKGKLCPVFGKFKDLATTGVEVSVGIRSGTLKVERVNKLIVLIEMEPPEVLPFKVFVENAYERKNQSEKGSTDYVSAKLELNASYGKLIESRTETPVADDVGDLILPYVEDMETDFGHMYYKEYIETLREDSEKSFEEVYPELVEKVLSEFPEELIKSANFKRLSLTELNYGRYVVPAGASLITATSRARLLAVMKITNALYWDTDSVFIKDYNPDTINEKLETATKWLPPFVVPLVVGDNLGELDCEIEKASGYLAGTKRYYLETKDGKIKKAMHGIPTAPFTMAEEMIKSLATGKNFKYEGRQRPKGVKETKKPEEVGRFFSREFESQFHLDTRLEWERSSEGWVGTVKEIKSIKGEEQ